MPLNIQTPPAPVLIEERSIDMRAARFGKHVVERDFKMANGKVFPILCVTAANIYPVILFPMTDRGTIYLLNQFRFGTKSWVHELPGGCPKPTQGWEEAAAHELREEIGAVATKLEKIGGPMPLNPALEDNTVVAVVATGCKLVGDQKLDQSEEAIVSEVTVAEFRKLVKEGMIVDSKTVAIGYLALDHLGFLG